MTAFDLILNLQKIIDQGKGHLPVYAVDGRNGTSDEIDGGFYVATVDDSDDGDLLELTEGTEYVSITIG